MGRCYTRCHPRLFLRSLFETKAVVANGPPPTSVRAYKSRQSRIPRGRLIALELSRGGVDEASAPGETGPPNVSRVGRRQGVTRRIGTMKGWSVYLGGEGVGPERRPYMQMVRIYREQRAAYEYVKWEMKQNERKREKERRRDVGGGVRSGAGLNENGNGRDRGWYLAPFRGKYDRKGEEDTNGKVERRLMIDDRRFEQVG